MQQYVSTEEAIDKGHRMVSQPARLIFLAPTFFWFFIVIVGGLPFWEFPAELIFAFVLSRLYKNFMITRWRLWAFENVHDVQKLKERALREKLIWKDGSFFEKNEMLNAAQKQKWALLKNRFNEEVLFIDNPGVPGETVIYFDKEQHRWLGIVYAGCIIIALYQIIGNKSYIYGSVLLLLSSYWFYGWYKVRTDSRPQVILNSNGITTQKKGFHRWREISDDHVISETAGRSSRVNYYLVYNYPDGKVRLYLNNLKIDKKTLNDLLELYRGRNNENIHHGQRQV